MNPPGNLWIGSNLCIWLAWIVQLETFFSLYSLFSYPNYRLSVVVILTFNSTLLRVEFNHIIVGVIVVCIKHNLQYEMYLVSLVWTNPKIITDHHLKIAKFRHFSLPPTFPVEFLALLIALRLLIPSNDNCVCHTSIQPVPPTQKLFYTLNIHTIDP